MATATRRGTRPIPSFGGRVFTVWTGNETNTIRMAAAPSPLLEQGGFECEFLEKPPKAIQSECPVCLLILREPYQTICCGKSYCQVCIERLKTDKIICACCKKPIKEFPNIGLKQSLYDFEVYCINKNCGCQWTGELRQLDSHLNSNPSRENQLKGCQFQQLRCLHCFRNIQRSLICTHQNKQCQKRPFICKYCEDFKSNYEDVTINHYPVCGYYLVQCPNSCGKTMHRRNVASHIVDCCPLSPIDCDFSLLGCKTRCSRKDMSAHLSDNVVTHLSLQLASYQNTVARLDQENKQLGQRVDVLTRDLRIQKEEMVKLEGKNKQLELLVMKLAQDCTICSPLCPLELTMTGFDVLKINSDDWQCKPFYTHSKGYKLCLRVYPNGCSKGRGTHVSVYVYVMRGEFDELLQWPFRGIITIQLFNQMIKDDHHTKLVHFGIGVTNNADKRVVEGDRAATSWGKSKFISHAHLSPKYLKDDCLRFYVQYQAEHPCTPVD